MQSIKAEPRCVAIVSSVPTAAPAILGSVDALVDSDWRRAADCGRPTAAAAEAGRWRRSGSLSCNGDLCPALLPSPYCKRSNTTAALCSVVSPHGYDINENPHPVSSSSAYFERDHHATVPAVISSTSHLNQLHALTDNMATAKNSETLRVRPPSAPPSYSSIISLAGLDCIDYPDYHFDNLDHPGPNPEVDFVDQVPLDCPTAGLAAGGASGVSLDSPAGSKGRSGGSGGHKRHPRDGPSIMGSPSLRATARMMRKHYR